MMNIANLVWRRLRGTSYRYKTKHSILNVPNTITLLGVCLSLLYFYFAYSSIYLWLLPLFHLGVILSDVLDGVCADFFDQHTVFGKLFDPFRDRLHALVVMVHIVLISPTTAVAICVAITIFSELMIAVRCIMRKINEPHCIGKLRMAIQSVIVLYMLVSMYWLTIPVDVVVVAGIFAVASLCAFISYLFSK